MEGGKRGLQKACERATNRGLTGGTKTMGKQELKIGDRAPDFSLKNQGGSIGVETQGLVEMLSGPFGILQI
jgi:hypothetical protein